MAEVEVSGVRKPRVTARGADPFGFDPAMRERAKAVLRFLYKYYWRVEVEGLEYLPKEGPVLLAANHFGALPFDAAMISMAVEEEASLASHRAHALREVRDRPPLRRHAVQRLGGVEAST
jgi:1-acyl-sn-glycerol-3-phosphate acyltransferase